MLIAVAPGDIGSHVAETDGGKQRGKLHTALCAWQITVSVLC